MSGEPRYAINELQDMIAVLLRCPDKRLPRAHKRFIAEELRFEGGSYFSLKRAGGPLSLARQKALPRHFRTLLHEIRMFVKMHPEMKYIVILSHEDCKGYDELVGKRKGKNPERKDCLKAAKLLQELFPDKQIGAYHARFDAEDPKKVYFETVFETVPIRKVPTQQPA